MDRTDSSIPEKDKHLVCLALAIIFSIDTAFAHLMALDNM